MIYRHKYKDDFIRETYEFPIGISDNKRYFVDRNGKPFFIFADTSWKLFWEFTLEEAETYLDNRRDKGFTVIQVQLLPHREYQANRNGHGPFLSRGDMASPNPDYFDHVDKVISMAEDKGLAMLISPAWASRWEQDWYKHLSLESAEVYSRYLAKRYRNFNNIMGWIHGGDDDAIKLHDIIRLSAQTMKKEAPHQLHSFHGYIKGGWQHFHGEDWFDFSMAYAYDYEAMLDQLEEAYSLSPVCPVFLTETHYEYNKGVKTSDIRKYGWTSSLLGIAGHTYGNKDIWIYTCFWTLAVDADGAKHFSIMKRLYDGLEWFELEPDKKGSSHIIEGLDHGEDYAPSAWKEDGSLGIVYIPSNRKLKLDGKRLAEGIRAFWFDPTSGFVNDMGFLYQDDIIELESPGVNSAGDEDWVLVLKTK